MNSKDDAIFRNGSKTYYFSSIFFPPEIRKKVTTLYAYVRTVDDFVDNSPPHKKNFYLYKHATLQHKKNIDIIANFLHLAEENKFQKEWIPAFLNSMELDLNKKTYNNYGELETYMYGSANVIGYMMAALMKLPEKAFEYAGLQGKAMQLINFIRDIREDYDLSRVYVPQEDMELFNLKHIIPQATDEQTNFCKLVRFEIERYYRIQEEAEKGYVYIPKRYLIPIKTAANMYLWTAKKIYDNPLLVLEAKIKPSKARIFTTVIKHFITL